MRSSSQEVEVTRSLSNVIKSYNIRYTENKKEIDMNQRAEEFQRLYIESLPKFKEIEEVPEPEVQETYFLTDDSGMVFPQTEEEIAQFCENAKKKLQSELQKLREAAEEECRLLRVEAEEECKKMVSESAKSTEAEKQRILSEAQSAGYEEGRQRAEQETEALRQELAQTIKQHEIDYANKVEALEPDIVELLIGMVHNLTGVLLDERRDIILHIIRHSMLGIENSSSFIVRVSKDDYDFLNSRKQELLNELQGNKIEIVIDPMLRRAQCTIETDTRIIDCSLDVQLKNLTSDLKMLAGIF